VVSFACNRVARTQQKGLDFWDDAEYDCLMKSQVIRIAASILAADLTQLGAQVREAEHAGVDCFHVDVMDGVFVPNITFGPLVVKAMRRLTELPLLVHLMIIQPEHYVAEFAAAGASSILVHQETCPHLHRSVQQIKALGLRAGIVLNPATPVELLSEIVPELDAVLLMTVNPGFGGQQFILSAIDKIRRMRGLLDQCGSSADLEVDGGVDHLTAPRVVAAGANVLVAGQAVFGRGVPIAEAVARLRRSVAVSREASTKREPASLDAGSGGQR
jgi:ribulose-phosphate 3-epimerase